MKALRGDSLRKLPVRYSDLAYGGRPTVNVLPRFRKATAITLKRSLGDGGVDIIGNLARFPFVVQCKDRRRKLVVRELEGTLSRYHKDTIGIIVIPSDDKFTTQARRAARTSEFNIILTDKEKICSDLINFVEH
ncbi:12459_t:CDS:2 [Funneliformis mosseae]|uniref:12459_t:CDS:1 n=1 Tax=Funneliformis mosseae TaxID=27381 RepID=A0A9N9FJA5_FUNMO|nr:12459_t:CDS:2 [Funneliformis mosseae]